jgi:glucokinase
VITDPGGLAIGVDVGGTKTLGLVVGPSAQVLCELRRTTFQGQLRDGGARVVADLVALLEALHEEAGLSLGAHPIGVGLPGMVDRSGRLVYAPNLPSASSSSMLELLQEALGAPLSLENDANCAAVAEHVLGAGRGHGDLLMITLGTGVGGGVIHGGLLFRGGRGFAGELGHMVVEADGPACPCGARGCWERYVSGTGIERMARQATEEGRLEPGAAGASLRAAELASLARLGDDAARGIFESAGWWLARGLANLVGLFDPTCIVLGGGLSDAVEFMLPTIEAQLPPMLEGAALHPVVELHPAAFGERAGALGASLVARRAP